MTTRSAKPRALSGRLAGASLAALLAVSVSGCQLASPIATDFVYDPADGETVRMGDVQVSDLLVVSPGEGEPGIVSGLVTNESDEPVTVTLLLEDRTELAPPQEVSSGGAVRLDGREVHDQPGGEPVTIAEVAERPGSYITLLVSASTGQTVSTLTPVVAPEPPYDQYTTDEAEVTSG